MAKITVKILHFLCSPSYSRSRTTPWTRQNFCLIQHSWSHILCTQLHRILLLKRKNSNAKSYPHKHYQLLADVTKVMETLLLPISTDKQTSRRQSILTFKNWGLNVFLQAPPLCLKTWKPRGFQRISRASYGEKAGKGLCTNPALNTRQAVRLDTTDAELLYGESFCFCKGSQKGSILLAIKPLP